MAVKARQNSPESRSPQWRRSGGAVAGGVNLEKAMQPCLPFSPVSGSGGGTDSDGDMLFQKCTWFGTAFPFECGLFPVSFQGPVDGSGAYGQEHGLDVCGDRKGDASPQRRASVPG
jgi:hypothetical protein